MIAAREAGFKSLAIDLIYGLPKQNPISFNHALDEVIRLGPDRLSIYNYAHVPNLAKAQRRINEADLPPTPTEEQGHLLVAESGNIRLYRMTTGELQVRNGPNADGKEYAFIWDGCPATGGTAYTIANGIATRAE